MTQISDGNRRHYPHGNRPHCVEHVLALYMTSRSTVDLELEEVGEVLIVFDVTKSFLVQGRFYGAHQVGVYLLVIKIGEIPIDE